MFPLLKDRSLKMAMVTLSEAGVYIAFQEDGGKFGSALIPAHIRNIADVSGAGDTVIAVATLCLAARIGPVDTAALANLAGGLVCEEVGVVPIIKDKLFAEASSIISRAE